MLVREERKLVEAAKAANPDKDAASLPYLPATNLRTLEDCLTLIEYVVDELLRLENSIKRNRVLLTAANYAGGLLIKAQVGDAAVDWFADNVKLVAGIDLDKV